jgi:hypothetical protein
MTTSTTVPVSITDDVNAQILAVSEDKLQGFQPDPIGEIARRSGVDVPTVIERIQAMLRAGTIRRVRQTLMATNLARGALIAWQVPEERLTAAFEWMFQQDPFSGHVVIRSTDQAIAGAKYRLWTTLKVPQGFSMAKHCDFLCRQTGALTYKLLPAKKLFVLGVGHVRRKGLEPGSKSDVLADAIDTNIVELSDREWEVLIELKREFGADEISENLWQPRADARGIPLDEFYAIAHELNRRKVIGRFSTFLEHVKQLKSGEQVTKYNALFHWAVPQGREMDAGREVGRFHVMTHGYWREAGAEFGNVNVMGVAHGTDKDLVLAHKRAIDEHLTSIGIPVTYTNVFWGGRSEIKPSEIAPDAYREFCRRHAIDPESMKDDRP